MKVGKLGSAMKALIPALRELGATGAAANLNLLMTLFNDVKDVDEKEFAEAANKLGLAAAHDRATVGEVAQALVAIIALCKACGATRARIAGLEAATACIGESNLAKFSFDDFAAALKKELTPDVVALHLSALQATLGTPEFDDAYAALEKDRRVKKIELAAIATAFVSKTAQSAAKGQTLKRIYARHLSLVDSTNKREWQKGKSAA
jgi:hypothetical protein